MDGGEGGIGTLLGLETSFYDGKTQPRCLVFGIADAFEPFYSPNLD
jgi:hypothetical protein